MTGEGTPRLGSKGAVPTSLEKLTMSRETTKNDTVKHGQKLSPIITYIELTLRSLATIHVSTHEEMKV
jgi:hypothetical protein